MVRAILLTTLVIALLGIGTVHSPPVSAADADLPTLTGLTSNDRDEDLERLEAVVGRYPSLTQIFWRVELDWPNGWAPAMLEGLHEQGMTAVVEITVDDLGALNAGALDGSLQSDGGDGEHLARSGRWSPDPDRPAP